MKLFSLLPKRLVHLACNSPKNPWGAGPGPDGPGGALAIRCTPKSYMERRRAAPESKYLGLIPMAGLRDQAEIPRLRLRARLRRTSPLGMTAPCETTPSPSFRSCRAKSRHLAPIPTAGLLDQAGSARDGSPALRRPIRATPNRRSAYPGRAAIL